jgi:EAL domain-containing protein (putative c-di-GMP-specific phosphodiesterase class I)
MKESSLRSVAELSKFIELGEFRYAAQIIRPATSEDSPLHWYEWLIRPRLADPSVTTTDFIHAVVSLDLSLDLDMRAVRDALIWLDQQPVTTHLTVNVSAASFANRHFAKFVQARIKQSHIQPEQLCFDLTVHDAVGDLSSATQFIKTMRRLGCQIALDDGVPGNPVLGLFAPLGFIDYLKIDRRWVGPAPESQSHRETLESVIDYGKRLGLSLIAEGVDNEHHLKLIRDLEVDFYQGFIHGEPQIIAGVRDDQLIIDQNIA